MPGHERARWWITASFGLLLLACGGGALPAELPVGSPASTRGSDAPPAVVTRALDEEPPLPGEPVEGWPGLAPSAAEDAPPEEHRHAH